MMPMQMTSHDQKSHVASHFDHLDLTNRMVLLMILLISCDTDTASLAFT